MAGSSSTASANSPTSSRCTSPAYIETLQATAAKPPVKQHLAAIRMLFDWLIIGQVLAVNPAHAVRGPKHVIKRGKTPVLTEDQARRLLESIDTSNVVGLRDRALIGVMIYSFARIGAVVAMRVRIITRRVNAGPTNRPIVFAWYPRSKSGVPPPSCGSATATKRSSKAT